MCQPLWGVELKDWLTIAAIAISPLVALQVQEWLAKRKERRGQKSWVFHTLMNTRGTRLTELHVQALNRIDLTFYGKRFGKQRQTSKEQAVTDAWRSYLAHLTAAPADPAGQGVWNGQSQELFVNLLVAMATDAGYEFDRDQISRGGYVPVAHGTAYTEQEVSRRLLLEVLVGDRALKMEVTKIATDPAVAAAVKDFYLRMAGAVDDDRALNVKVTPPNV